MDYKLKPLFTAASNKTIKCATSSIEVLLAGYCRHFDVIHASGNISLVRAVASIYIIAQGTSELLTYDVISQHGRALSSSTIGGIYKLKTQLRSNQ